MSGEFPEISSLEFAVMLGDELKARELLESGADPNALAQGCKMPLLMTALFSLEPIPVISLLLEFGADVNATDTSGNTALTHALKFGKEDEARVLRDAGARIGPVESACLGDTNGLRAFLEKEEGDDWRRGWGSDALEHAVICGLDEIIDLLIEHEVELNSRTRGRSALAAAINQRNEKAALRLIESGANVREAGEDRVPLVNWAARRGLFNAVAAMLERGAELNALDERGRTPLMWAATHRNAEAVRFLLEAGPTRGP